MFWVDFGEPVGSAPALRRPALVVQADGYNTSRISTIVLAVITSNLAAADFPGNVFLPATITGLPKDSVVNVTQLITLNRFELIEYAGAVPPDVMPMVDAGLSRVLGLR